MVIRTRFKYTKNDGSWVRFNNNNNVLFKKRTTSQGKVVFGPVIKNINRKKFLSSFPGVI